MNFGGGGRGHNLTHSGRHAIKGIKNSCSFWWSDVDPVGIAASKGFPRKELALC